MTRENDQDMGRAKSQAKAALASIVAMVARLEHSQQCSGDPDDCELTSEEVFEGLGYYYPEGKEASEEDREQYHDEEQARETISEDALSVEVRSDWIMPGQEKFQPAEFRILLSTGGPASRIIGELDVDLEPYSVRLQYQDWFTPWVDYFPLSDEEKQALEAYAREFYYS